MRADRRVNCSTIIVNSTTQTPAKLPLKSTTTNEIKGASAHPVIWLSIRTNHCPSKCFCPFFTYDQDMCHVSFTFSQLMGMIWREGYNITSAYMVLLVV